MCQFCSIEGLKKSPGIPRYGKLKIIKKRGIIMRKIISVILAMLLVISMVPMTAFANDGPVPYDQDLGWDSFSSIGIGQRWKELKYESITEQNYDELYDTLIYANGEIVDDFNGVSYDIESNTLTLNNAQLDEYMISAVRMGDDFKIDVVGDCEVGQILVAGCDHGGSLEITGEGNLVVNNDTYCDYGVIMLADGQTAKMTFDIVGTTNIYGSNAASVTVKEHKYDFGDLSDVYELHNGRYLQLNEDYEVSSYTQNIGKHIGGYVRCEGNISSECGYKIVPNDAEENDDEKFVAMPQEDQSWFIMRYVYEPSIQAYIRDIYFYTEPCSEEELLESYYFVTENNDRVMFTLPYSYDYDEYDEYTNEFMETYAVETVEDDNGGQTQNVYSVNFLPVSGIYYFEESDVDVNSLTRAYEDEAVEGYYNYYLLSGFEYVGDAFNPIGMHTGIYVYETDENGEQILDKEGEPIQHSIYENGNANYDYVGISFDDTTDTLFIDEVNDSSLVLDISGLHNVNMELSGDVCLGRIIVWPQGENSSLRVGGSGKLTVNPNGVFENAIIVNAMHEAPSVTFAKNITVELYGRKDSDHAAKISCTSNQSTNGTFVFEDGYYPYIRQEPYQNHRARRVEGYKISDNPRYDRSGMLASSQSDPNGIYVVNEYTRSDDNDNIIESGYDVQKLIYLDWPGVYVPDLKFGEHGNIQMSVEEFEASDYEFVLDNDENTWIDYKSYDYSTAYEVYRDPTNGYEYIVDDEIINGELQECVYDYQVLVDIDEHFYALTLNENIKPENLEQVYDDEVVDGIWNYELNGNYFYHEPTDTPDYPNENGHISFSEVTENGELIVDENDEEIRYDVWDGKTLINNMPGAYYDDVTNTLNLSNLNASNYLLTIIEMSAGNGLIINVYGDCKIARIDLIGGGYYNITGSGTLTINEDKVFDVGIYNESMGKTTTIALGQGVSINLYGSKHALESVENTVVNENDALLLNNGQYIDLKKEPLVINNQLHKRGYMLSTIDNGAQTFDVVRNGSFPNDMFAETHYAEPDGQGGSRLVYCVSRYVYSNRYQDYFKDYSFGSYGTSQLSEQDFNDFYYYEYNAQQEKVQFTVQHQYEYSQLPVYHNATGDKYALRRYMADDEEIVRTFSYEDILELDDAVFFTEEPDIDSSDFEPEMEDRLIEDVYTIFIDSDEFIYGGGQQYEESVYLFVVDIDRQTGEIVYTDEGTTQLYGDNEMMEELDGAVYDADNKVLTLNNLNAPNRAIVISGYDSDFTVNVQGENSIGCIEAFPSADNANLIINGDGKLTINASWLRPAGITCDAVNKNCSIIFGEDVVLYVFGQINSVRMNASAVQTIDEAIVFENGEDYSVVKEPTVDSRVKEVSGYSVPDYDSGSLLRKVVASKSNPNDIYYMYKNTVYLTASQTEEYYILEKYIYSDTLQDYFMDTKFGNYGSIELSSDEFYDNYEYVLDNNGYEKEVSIRYSYNYWEYITVYKDANNREYGYMNYYSNGNNMLRIFEMEEIPEIENTYRLTEVFNVDPSSLTPVEESKIIEGVYDYHIDDSEFAYNAGEPDPSNIELVDIGNIWTNLEADKDVPFTTELNPDSACPLEMTIFEEKWINVNNPEEYISSNGSMPAIPGVTYAYEITLKAKRGFVFVPEFTFIYGGSEVNAECDIRDNGKTMVLSGFIPNVTVEESGTQLLAPPSQLYFQNYERGLGIAWDGVFGAEKYRIYKKNETNGWDVLAETTETDFVDVLVESDTEYTYSIACIDEQGNLISTFDNVGFSTTFIEPPYISELANTVEGVQITWTASELAHKFTIDRSTDGENWQYLGLTTERTYTDTEVESGTTYYYKVGATSESGYSMLTPMSQSGTIKFIATPVPYFQSYRDGVSIAWDRVEGAEGYRVFRKYDTNWISIGDTNTGTEYIDRSVTSGESYTYSVVSLDRVGRVVSGFDETGKSFTFIAPPVISSIKNTATGVELKWTAAAAAKRFVITKSDDNENSWSMLTTTTGKTYVDTNVESGKTYIYKIVVSSEDGTHPLSDVSETASIMYLAVPVLSEPTNTLTGVKLAWGKVAGATKYAVLVKSGTSWSKLGVTSNTSYIHTGAVSGRSYTYTVVCVDAQDNYISAYDTTGKTITFVAVPVISSLTNTATGIKVTWGAVKGAGKYRLYVKKNGTGWTKLADVTTTEYTDTNVESNVEYYYTIRCLSADGKKYLSGTDNIGNSKLFIGAPVISSVTNTTAGVKIVWGATAGAAKYRVFVKTAGTSWKKLADTASTSYVHNAAVSGTTYAYTIRCIDANGQLPGSYDAKGKSILFIGSPQISKIENASNGAKITWGKVTGIAKYRVFVKTAKTSWKKLADTTSVSYVHTAAVSGTTYYYTIRGIDANGKYAGSYYSSGWSNQFVAMPVITLTNTSTGIKISWKKIAGAGKYRIFIKSGTSWKKVTDTTAVSYVYKSVKVGTSYTFTVRCISADGKKFVSAYNTKGKTIKYTR